MKPNHDRLPSYLKRSKNALFINFRIVHKGDANVFKFIAVVTGGRG